MSLTIHRMTPVELAVKEGRTVEAYASVFDTEAEIRDHEGHYLETIDGAAFNRAINRAKPQGGRDYWKTQVFYNHGMTLHGTPSERYSTPIGTTVHIEADTRGLLTVTRYAETPLGDEILELIRSGAIRAQSFTGRIEKSAPEWKRGQPRQPQNGKLTSVRRLELGLEEYGPTPIPAYDLAEIVGVRSLDLGALRALLQTAPEQDSAGSGADPDGSLAVDDSPARRSETSPDRRRLTAALRARGINP